MSERERIEAALATWWPHREGGHDCANNPLVAQSVVLACQACINDRLLLMVKRAVEALEQAHRTCAGVTCRKCAALRDLADIAEGKR